MFESIDSNIYSSPRNIYIERLEKNLRQFLEEKAGRISRIGKDILVELDRRELNNTLAELKNNPELSVDVLKNLKVIWDGKKSYLLSEFMAADYDHSIILKTGFSGKAALEDSIHKFMEYYSASEYIFPVKDAGNGPHDLDLSGMMLGVCSNFDISLNLEDDIIQKAFIHRDNLKVLNRDFFKGLEIEQLVSYMGRFDYNAGVFGELAFCQGIEELLQLEIPRRAESLRILISELFRITSHLAFLSRLSEIMGHDLAANMIMIERETLLGIIEVMTGARIIPNFIRIGGVSSRVGSDIIKRIKRTMALFVKDFLKVEKILTTDFTVIEKLKGLGPIDRDKAGSTGLSGPNLRASGPRYDLRKEPGSSIYRDIHFTVPYARGGSCLERMTVRIGEIQQSARIIMQAAEKIPSGPVLKRINLSHLDFDPVPFTSSVECPHGIFKIFGEVEGNSLRSFAVLGPSTPALSIASGLLEGNTVDDIEVIISSLDISYGEIMDYV